MCLASKKRKKKNYILKNKIGKQDTFKEHILIVFTCFIKK